MDSNSPDQGSVFSSETNGTVVPNQPAPNLPTEVVGLIGEGKKYASPEEALKSIPHAQTHIQKLQEELEALRGVVTEQTEELKKRATAAQAVSQIHQQPAQSTKTEALDINAVIQAAKEAGAQGAKDAALQEQHNSNELTVSQKMREVYGNNEAAGKAIAAKAAEMDVPPQYLREIARTKPKMYMQIMGLEDTHQPITKNQAPVKTSGMQSLDAVTTNNTSSAPRKSVLAGATTKEVIAEWRRCGDMIKEGNN